MFFCNSKRIITITLFTMLIVIFFVGVVFSAETPLFRLRLSTAQPAPHSFSAGMEYFKERAEQLTDGRLIVELHGGGVLGVGQEGIENLRMGTLEAVVDSIGPMTPYVPAYGLLNLPYLLTDIDRSELLLEGVVGDELKELALEKGLRVLGWWNDQHRNFYGNKEISTIEDIKGMKIRTMDAPVIMSMYKAWGAIPVPMNFPEVYTALQTGVIDDVDCTVMSGWSASHHEVSKYLTIVNYVYAWNHFVISEIWWQKLPKDIQQAIIQAEIEARKVNKAATAKYAVQSNKAWEEYGIKIKELDLEELEPFKKLAIENVHANWLNEAGDKASEIYDMVRKYTEFIEPKDIELYK